MCCVGGAEADWLAAVIPKVFSDSSDQSERDRECEKEDGKRCWERGRKDKRECEKEEKGGEKID